MVEPSLTRLRKNLLWVEQREQEELVKRVSRQSWQDHAEYGEDLEPLRIVGATECFKHEVICSFKGKLSKVDSRREVNAVSTVFQAR